MLQSFFVQTIYSGVAATLGRSASDVIFRSKDYANNLYTGSIYIFVTFPLVLICSFFIVNYLERHFVDAILISIIVVVSGLIANQATALNVHRKIILASLHISGLPLLRIFIIILVKSIFDISITALLLIYLVSGTIIYTIQSSYIKLPEYSLYHCNFTFQKNISNKIINGVKNYFPWTLILWFYQSTDKIIITWLIGFESLSEYSILYIIGYSSIMAIVGVVIKFVQPIMYSNATAKKLDYKIDIAAYGVVLSSSLLLALAVAFYDAELISLVSNSSYTNRAELLIYFVFAGAFYGASEIALMRLQSSWQVEKIRNKKTLSSLLGISVLLISTWSSGLEGAVAGLVLSSIFTFIIMTRAAYGKKIFNYR
jgi:O-antigen/teichoic acid export membrane protein